jgi:hypothetical protein
VVTVADGLVDAKFDLESLQSGLEAHFRDPVSPAIKPALEVVGGIVKVVEIGRVPQVCCDQGSSAIIADRILSGAPPTFLPIALEPRGADDPIQTAYADGSMIVEEVSSFTTRHGCCENRVKNIHQIADIVDGVYLYPDEVFSLNEFVGPRTRAAGFVAAGAIRRGHLKDEVGGGVSQFATTFFNAAFFAGLDFEQYRSHSIYFSRYPYGREATISTPGPDLVINNTTRYPLLIDTSYTETSITVSFYSTPNVTVEQMGQRTFRRRACTHVETDRQRMYDDGRVILDTFFADYRPADGVDCNGNPIPETVG